jgi:hypothetical protein
MEAPGLRLRLRTFAVLVAIAGFSCYLIRVMPKLEAFLCFWILALTSILVICWITPPDPPTRSRWLAFALLLGSATVFELYASYLAYYTIGEIVSSLYLLAIGVNLLPMIVVARRFRYACVLLISLWMWLVPYQLYLLARWTVLDGEMRSVVARVEAIRARTGAYPAGLSQVPFSRPEFAKEFIYQFDPKSGRFFLSYHVGSSDTSHDYYSAHGHFYYPD